MWRRINAAECAKRAEQTEQVVTDEVKVDYLVDGLASLNLEGMNPGNSCCPLEASAVPVWRDWYYLISVRLL